MRISRLVLSGAAIGTIAGTARADLNRSHVFNPRLAAPRPIPQRSGVGQHRRLAAARPVAAVAARPARRRR